MTARSLGDGGEDDRGVDVALAEFNALRAEISSRLASQKALTALALTSFAGLFTFALGSSGDRHYLLAIPPLGLMFTIFSLAEAFQIHRMGTYIREHLWVYLMSRTTYECSWEGRQVGMRRAPRLLLLAGFFETAFPALLVVAGTMSLIVAGHVSAPALITEVVCIILIAAAPAAFGAVLRASEGSTEH